MTPEQEEPAILLGGDGNDHAALMRAHPDVFGSSPTEALRELIEHFDRVNEERMEKPWAEVDHGLSGEGITEEFFVEYMTAMILYAARDVVRQPNP